jgi:UDP-N-acetylglucosamine 4,6-dehydratase/5-epimerase
MLKDKTLLITGGTGSFGNAVLRRFLDTDVGEIRCLSRDEKKQEDMRLHYANPKLKFYIADVRDEKSIREAVSGADYVFHAAALKQVPGCEFYPMQALYTNAIGTDNLLAAASAAGVERTVVLSTDKAAYPINAMGISKAMMEKIAVAKARTGADVGHTVSIARYGNVMGSRGSVIPLFVTQLMQNRPITITNPNMRRFMMSMDDAVDQVLYAFEHAEPGDLFVLKAPAAAVSQLAEALMRIFDTKAEIQVIGARHGEKLYETLLTSEEKDKAVDCGSYFRVPADSRGLDYTLYVDKGVKSAERSEEFHSLNARALTTEEVTEVLRRLDVVKDGLRGILPA